MRQRCDRNVTSIPTELGSNLTHVTMAEANTELQSFTLVRKNYLDEYLLLGTVQEIVTTLNKKLSRYQYLIF